MAVGDIRLVLASAPSWLPDHLQDSDGLYSFDIDENTTVAITKQIDAANTVGVILQDTVRNFTLPPTEKNAAFIGPVGNPNAFNFIHEASIDVKIFVGIYELPETKFNVRQTGDRPFEVEAFGEANEWVTGLANTKLNSLDYGITPPYDWTFVDDLHQNKFAYIDGELPIFVPYVNYGRRRDSSCISLEDLRVWHSALFILRESFCKIGWTFNCPILETDYGRRIWTYILAEDFATRNVGINKGFNAILTLNTVMDPFTLGIPGTGLVLFDNDSVSPGFDNANLYDPLTGEYQGTNLVADFYVQLEVTGAPGGGTDTPGVLIIIEKFNTVTGAFDNLAATIEGPLAAGTNTFTINSGDKLITNDEIVRVIAMSINYPCTIDQFNSKFWNIPKATVTGEGDIIDPALIIDPAYNALDYLKGVAHVLNLKHETDVNSKTVSFYPEDGIDLYADGEQEAFYKPNSKAIDWTNKVKCKSLATTVDITKNKRNLLLQFKEDSGDWNLQNTGLEFPLHSKNIDFGERFAPGTEDSPNPFFAATYNDFDFDVRWIWLGSTFPDSSPWMPKIWKSEPNEDGTLPEAATKIVPRILLAKPYMRMLTKQTTESGLATSGDIRTCNSISPDGYLNKAFYAPVSQIWLEGWEGISPTIPFPIDDEALVYGTGDYVPELPGMYELAYLEGAKRLYSVIPLEFLVDLSFLDFINFSHRDKRFIRYYSEVLGELVFYCIVTTITDYVLNKQIVTPVLVTPDSSRFTLNCCDCNAAVEFVGETPPTLTFNTLIIGDCGEVESFAWTLTNLNPAINLGIVGPDDQQTIQIGGNGPVAQWAFIVEVTVVTECGTFVRSYQYN